MKPKTVEIKDFSEVLNVKRKSSNENPLLPKWPFRMIICGPSGCGKTNLVLNLILKHLRFENLYVYAKMIDEHSYSFVQDIYTKLKEKTGNENGFFSCGLEDVIELDALNKEERNLIIFDDFINEKDQSVIDDYFTRGRKCNCSTIYVTQSWFQTPSIPRRNASCIALLGNRNNNEIGELYKDLGFGISKDEFKNIYNKATERKGNFLFIDKEAEEKYKINFDNNVY